VMAACASCYARLRTANHLVRDDAQERARVEAITGQHYAGEVAARHLLDVLVNDYRLENVRARITRPLAGLRVACYYGCLLSRPPEVVAFDDPEHPACMDELVDVIGGQAVEWPYKTECCGASLSISGSEVVARLSHRLLAMAHKAGAECIAVACPLCHVNLDLRQADGAKAHGQLAPMPVLYVTQLLGLALGLSGDQLGLNALTVSAEPVLARCAAAPRSPASREGAVVAPASR
jgi:heterodisulfide reductase subunit B2